jgi:hypothetical protein
MAASFRFSLRVLLPRSLAEESNMVAPAIVLLALLAQASTAPPETQTKATAQGLLDEGSRLYGEGDYAGALDKFKTAYAAYPSPKLMFNIGQANRDLGRPVEALHAFEKFLADDITASPGTTADARKSLAELRDKLGRIRIDCQTAGAEVSIDGKSMGQTPLPEPIWATPGRHQVTANHAHAALAIENVTVSAGGLHTVALQLHSLADPVVAPAAGLDTTAASLTSAPAARDESASDQPLYKKWWVWTGVGAVVVGGAVTAFLLSRRSNDLCNGVGYTCLEIK